MHRRSFLGRTAAGGLLISSLNRGWAAKNDTAEGSVVSTSVGKIKGLFDGKVHAFKGVPYGASTAGDGRFMPPARPKPWSGVRNATESGPRSFQPVRIMVPEMGDALTGYGR
jgi:para-nitrobenzyl esterase